MGILSSFVFLSNKSSVSPFLVCQHTWCISTISKSVVDAIFLNSRGFFCCCVGWVLYGCFCFVLEKNTLKKYFVQSCRGYHSYFWFVVLVKDNWRQEEDFF